jgi:hypothetical protein
VHRAMVGGAPGGGVSDRLLIAVFHCVHNTVGGMFTFQYGL